MTKQETMKEKDESTHKENEREHVHLPTKLRVQ